MTKLDMWQQYNTFLIYEGEVCPSISTALTDYGLCPVINGVPIQDIHAPSPYLDMLFSFISNTSQAILKNDVGGGKSHMTLIIQGNQWPRDLGHDYYLLRIGEFMDLYAMAHLGIKIYPGHKHKIQIYANQHATSDDFQSLDLNVRKCRYSHENPFGNVSLFKQYNQKSCSFECKLRICERTLKCIPWFLPPVNASLPLCDGFWTYIFQHYMGTDHDENCQMCQPDCELITFHPIESKEKLDPKVICGSLRRKREDNFSFDAQRIAQLKLTQENVFLWRLKQILRGERGQYLGPNWADLISNESTTLINEGPEFQAACEDIVTKDIAIVEVEMMQNHMQKIMKQRRVQFSDKLGTLGGTLGLFTGMSFIGFVEIIFVIFQAFRQFLRINVRT